MVCGLSNSTIHNKSYNWIFNLGGVIKKNCLNGSWGGEVSDNEKKIEKYWSEEKQNACKGGYPELGVQLIK